MIETAVVIDKTGKPIHWPEYQGATGGSIPDSRPLWEVLWESRHDLGGVAHTHPWSGVAAPSFEDVTTFNAVERGLGRRLIWPIITLDRVNYFEFNGDYYAPAEKVDFCNAVVWIEAIKELRRRSSNGG